MSFMPKFPGSEYLPSCDEDCPQEGLGEKLLIAFVGGAAPVVAAYLINRVTNALSPEPEADEEDEE